MKWNGSWRVAAENRRDPPCHAAIEPGGQSLRTPVFGRRALSLAVTAALALVACGNNASNQSTNLAVDQTLRFAVDGDFGTFDPAHLNAETDQDMVINLFEALLKFDDNLNVIPDLA